MILQSQAGTTHNSLRMNEGTFHFKRVIFLNSLGQSGLLLAVLKAGGTCILIECVTLVFSEPTDIKFKLVDHSSNIHSVIITKITMSALTCFQSETFIRDSWVD